MTTNKQQDLSILALAAYWQQELQILVVTAAFYAGKETPSSPTPPSLTPCSLVTVEPFAPGGLRRLVLNVHNPLIQQLARALHQREGNDRVVVTDMGKAMVWSASWPIPILDGLDAASVHWKMPRGLVADPLFVWPVPHEPRRRISRLHGHGLVTTTALTIWPRRVASVELTRHPDGAPTTAQPLYVGQLWDVREQGLEREFQNWMGGDGSGGRILSSRWFPGWRKSNSPQQPVTTSDETPLIRPFSSALLTYAPCLPVVCLAQALQLRYDGVPWHSALAEAAHLLLRHDRLFGLSLFFNVPLMDRTGILKGTLKTAPLARRTPTRQQVQNFESKIKAAHAKKTTDEDSASHIEDLRHATLQTLLLQRARRLWERTEASDRGDHDNTTKPNNQRGYMYVAWSGGIDSTAVLCAVLQTAVERDHRTARLRVLLDQDSIQENPIFYQTMIVDKHQLTIVPRQDQPLSWHEAKIRQQSQRSLLVTGELGDQLFGSDRCQAAFSDVMEEDIRDLVELQKGGPPPPPPEYAGVFAEKGLAAPWETTILPSMQSVGLLGEGGASAWKAWIAPQLAQAPFPIASTFDFLWWMNFSLKWQNVSLRCLHDGGTPILGTVATVKNVTGCIAHFYDDFDLECWSCVASFHAQKFADLQQWSTYKEPLKYFIREFDDNEEYYREKTKYGSLAFGAALEADSYVSRFYGAMVDLLPYSEQCPYTNDQSNDVRKRLDISAHPRLLTWGVCALTSPDGHNVDLQHLMHPGSLAALLRNYPGDTTHDQWIDPWARNDAVPGPFDVAPFFSEQDERQRRIFNPVTKITLEGKCAALLTRDLVLDRSFLDLGACLGASTHWALCMGASRATVVEIQESFCQRAREMLRRAQTQGCYGPSSPLGCGTGTEEPRFQAVCCGIREYLSSCANGSHDVILAAGLLHCFGDPVQILIEMARVASHAILIEMVHPALYCDGHLDDSDPTDAKMNGRLYSAVRPLPRRVEQGGLLQVAPYALVNMADNDASFEGLAVIPSRMAVESTMQKLGFEVNRVFLKSHSTMNDDILAYTGRHNYRALSSRYFIRCVRKLKTQDVDAPPCSLETRILANDQTKSVEWTIAKSWFSPESSEKKAHNPREDYLEQPNDDPDQKWQFDENIASRFAREALCHIPDYEDVIRDSVRLAEETLTMSATNQTKENVKVVDVGCATGRTLVRLLERGFRNVHGVDISRPMIEKAKENVMDAGFSEHVHLHTSRVETDLPATLRGELGAVFVNWTLQFVIEAASRKTFLRNIASKMSIGAILVLTEKTVQNSLTKGAYYSFKKRMGVSEKEIAVKEARLKGVLETLPVGWYLDVLSDSGFIDVSIYRAHYGFTSFLAIKGTDATKLKPDKEAAAAPVDSFQAWPDLSNRAKEVSYRAKESGASFVMHAWGESTGSVWEGSHDNGSVYGYVYSGSAELSILARGKNMSFTLCEGMYFCSSAQVRVKGGSGIIQLVDDHKAMFAIGGPLEEGQGRLPYIDGCTDTLLLAPAVKGAPCLNHLHFPRGIVQTRHTHPSGRSGVVVRGKGTCVYNDGGVLRRFPLSPGVAFVIPTNLVHAFETPDHHELDVIAFHPDSDFGPSSDDHPMINRTIVDGISASKISSIQTRT